MRNDEIANAFESLADLLEFKGENLFKVVAYRKVARVIRDLNEEVGVLAEQKRLRDLPGVGEGIEKKIVQLVTTGKMDRLEEARKDVPPGLFDMLNIPGVGPKTVALANKKLGIGSLEELVEAARSGRLAELPGMGAKKVENLLKGVEFVRQSGKRITLGTALPLVERLLEDMARAGLKGAVAAGSLRRMRDTIGDIDILIAARDSAEPIRRFTELKGVRRVLGAGETKASVIIERLQVDLRVVPPESFGAALQYFTGSKPHNIRLRGIARKRGLKLSEYGLFKGEKSIAGRTEEEVYAALDLPWVPPVLREDRGEIEAAGDGKLPKLIQEKDIRGDLHVHTNWSDGHNSIEEMAAAGKKRGYKYMVISDHSKALKVFGGLDPEKLDKQIAEVRKAARKVVGIQLLTGTEVDIRANGELDLPDSSLEKLDFVTASVHSAFKQDKATLTARIIQAVRNPHVDSIGHLTGRLLNERGAYDLDIDAVLAEAAKAGTALELNAQPARLDINDVVCRRAKELGVKVVINTDAHHAEDLGLMRFGVATAQRGWLEKSDVLNTRATPPRKRP